MCGRPTEVVDWPMAAERASERASERARLGFCFCFFDGAAVDSPFVMVRSFVVQFRNERARGKKGHRNEKNADSPTQLGRSGSVCPRLSATPQGKSPLTRIRRTNTHDRSTEGPFCTHPASSARNGKEYMYQETD